MSRLITGSEATKAMSQLRQGIALSNDPRRAMQQLQSMERSANDGSALQAARNAADRKTASNTKGSTARFGSTQVAMEKFRSPLDRFTQSALPHDMGDEEERSKVRELCRTYYKVHNLVPLLIDIYARFPIQGMAIEHQDPDLKQFYEELFFEDLDYESFLINFGREYFTVGEVNSLASFSELLGVWEHEDIINPDDLTVSRSPFSKDLRYHLKIPADIKNIIEHMRPRSDYEMLKTEYPEIIKAYHAEKNGNIDESYTGPGLEVSSHLLSRIINKTADWDLYGTPRMLRVFSNLNLEEGLLAAQKAIADRLYSPLILAKLGGADMLGDGEPWLPDDAALEAFTDTMQQAMSADFRFLTYHYGITIESVFGRENVPNLSDDFDRIERKILQAWGIGESLISGSSNGSYASSALNSELVNQLMSSYQKEVQGHFKKRCRIIAEAQGHFEYETRGGQRYPIIEEYRSVDPETGEETVKERPKLAIPKLTFKSMTLRDEETERQFLLTLKQSGIPISDQRLLETVDVEFRDEIELVAEEKARKIISNQEIQQKIITVLQEKGLQLTPELLIAIAQQTTPVPPELAPQASMGVGQDITSPVNSPNITQDPNAMAAAQQNAMTLPTMPPGAEAMQAPAGPGAAPAAPGVAPAGPAGPTLLPQNQVGQRPEISNQQSAGMPRRSKLTASKEGPTTVDARNNLTAESALYFVRERPWTRSLKSKEAE